MGLGDLGGLVYSTESGRMCPDCRHQLDDCICTNETIPEGDGIVRIHRETKGRKGKGVSLIQGVLATDSELKKLAKTLKSKCGVGGTVRDGVIEIQTDRRDLLKSELEQLGYAVKLAGG